MRADKNAAGAEKKETKDEGLEAMQKAETAVSERERIDESAEEKRRKTESWHTFKSP
jgi:hypothetical protein